MGRLHYAFSTTRFSYRTGRKPVKTSPCGQTSTSLSGIWLKCGSTKSTITTWHPASVSRAEYAAIIPKWSGTTRTRSVAEPPNVPAGASFSSATTLVREIGTAKNRWALAVLPAPNATYLPELSARMDFAPSASRGATVAECIRGDRVCQIYQCYRLRICFQ